MGSPITSANLVTAKASNSADTDIAAIFTMSSQNMTVVAGKNMEVRQGGVLGLGGTLTTSYLHLSSLSGSVIQGNNAITVNTLYTQSGGTFVGSNQGAAIIMNGNLIFRNSTFVATNGTMTIKAAFTQTGSSVFRSNSGTVVFDYGGGSTNLLSIPPTIDFYNVTFAANARTVTVKPGSLMRVRGNLLDQATDSSGFCGQLQAFSGVTITGGMYGITNCAADGDPTWTITGSGSRTITLPDTAMSRPNLPEDRAGQPQCHARRAECRLYLPSVRPHAATRYFSGKIWNSFH